MEGSRGSGSREGSRSSGRGAGSKGSGEGGGGGLQRLRGRGRRHNLALNNGNEQATQLKGTRI